MIKELVKIYKAYARKLSSQKLYDYEDMILKVIEKFVVLELILLPKSILF
jgi:hypothetical protein